MILLKVLHVFDVKSNKHKGAADKLMRIMRFLQPTFC